MNVNTILQSGVEGVQRANEGLEKAASEIVRAGSVDSPAGSTTGSTNSGVIEPIVDLKLYERSIEASAQVVKTADEVLGTLLDTLA